MSRASSILTNVLVAAAVAAGSILVYDTVRSGDAAAPASAKAPDVASLETRIAALERRIDGLASSRGERAVAARLDAIESRVAAALPEAGAAAGGAAAASDAGSADTPPAVAGDAVAAAAVDPSAPLTDAEVARFRRLQEKVDADRERERAAAMLDGILARLGLQLTPEQRTRLAAETVSFRQSVRDLFPGGPGGPGGGPGGGRSPQEAFAAVQELQRGFVSKLSEFIPAADASAIAAALSPAQRGPGGPGRGGTDGPPPR